MHCSLGKALILSIALAPFFPQQPSSAAPLSAVVQGQGSPAEATHLFQVGSAAFAAGDLKKAHSAFSRLVHLTPRVSVAHSAFGTVLLAEGEFSAALAQLTDAHTLDPRSSQIEESLAVAQSRCAHFQESVASFQQLPTEVLSNLPPTEALAYATALANSGNASVAETVLERCLTSSQPSVELLDALGSVQAQVSHDAAAKLSFMSALSLDAKYAPAHAHLGSLLLLQGEPEQAITELEQAIALGDTQTSTKLSLGRALSAAGRDDEAVALLKAIPASVSQSVDAQYALALALEAAGRSEEALPLLAKVVSAHPADSAALTNYGLALVQTGDAKAALQQYARAAAVQPPDAVLRQDTGVAYLQTNDVDHALEQFQLGLQLDQNNPQLHYDLGLAYKLKDDLINAVSELQRAEVLDPKLSDPPYTLAVIRMQQGKTNEAVDQFQQAVRLKPDNGEAWALLGSVLKDTGQLDAAADALHRAVQLRPDQPSPHITLAAVLTSKGDREGAAAERKVAADLSRTAMSRQRAAFSLQSGRALLRKGDLPGAVVQLNEAIEAQPDLKEAYLLLADALDRQGRTSEALAQRQKAEHLDAAH